MRLPLRRAHLPRPLRRAPRTRAAARNDTQKRRTRRMDCTEAATRNHPRRPETPRAAQRRDMTEAEIQNFDAFDPAHLESWEIRRRAPLPVASVDSITYAEYSFDREQVLGTGRVRTRSWSSWLESPSKLPFFPFSRTLGLFLSSKEIRYRKAISSPRVAGRVWRSSVGYRFRTRAHSECIFTLSSTSTASG